MAKRIITLLISVLILGTSCLALTPDTVSVYEKIDQIELVELSGSNLTMVYLIVGVICLLMVFFYLRDRKKKRALKLHVKNDNSESHK